METLIILGAITIAAWALVCFLWWKRPSPKNEVEWADMYLRRLPRGKHSLLK